jgi:hypothetical protein
MSYSSPNQPAGPQPTGYPPNPPGQPLPVPQGYVPVYVPIYGSFPAVHPRSTGNGLALTSFILGIIGILFTFLFFVGVIPAILSVVLGHLSLQQIRQSGGWQRGRGFAIAGTIMGYLVLGLALIVAAYFALAYASREH